MKYFIKSNPIFSPLAWSKFSWFFLIFSLTTSLLYPAELLLAGEQHILEKIPECLPINITSAVALLLLVGCIIILHKAYIRKKTKELKKINAELRSEIEDRIKAQDDLTKSEAQARQIIDYATDAIFFLQDNRITFSNRRTEEILGLSNLKLANTDYADLINPEDRDKIMQKLTGLNEEQTVSKSDSFRLYREDDIEVWVEQSTVLATWENKPAYLCFLRDITHELHFEQQIQQAQKLEAIGTLAGGIAHDFNNLLTGIQGHATLLLMDLDKNSPHYHDLKEIENIVKNAGNLTKQLLRFSRHSDHEVEPVNLNLLMDETLSMFSRTRKEIRITRRFEAGLLDILADSGQISQVFLNLFINASQAMPQGGDLTIEAKTILIHEEFGRHHGVLPGQFVKVTISDTGVGMDEAIRQRIFDPFFTTRKSKGGTGLGLASSYGIIKNHGGIITVESQKERGTTFSIFLPATETEAAPEEKQKDKIIKGEGTILVVDDEDSVLETSQLLLRTVGYKALTARTGMEAIAIYKGKLTDIDLVLLDIIMPGMDGAEVFQALKEIDPEVKVLLASGYSIESQAQKLMDLGCKGFIQKPFAIEDLSVKIHKILKES